jgi:hypothetical protein
MRGGLPPVPQYAFMAWCSVKKPFLDNVYLENPEEDGRMIFR